MLLGSFLPSWYSSYEIGGEGGPAGPLMAKVHRVVHMPDPPIFHLPVLGEQGQGDDKAMTRPMSMLTETTSYTTEF